MMVLFLATTWNYICESGLILTALSCAYIKSSEAEGDLIAIEKVIQPYYTQLRWPLAIQVGVFQCSFLRFGLIVSQLMINDGIVVWRACTCWPDAKLFRYTIIILMIGNIGAFHQWHMSKIL